MAPAEVAPSIEKSATMKIPLYPCKTIYVYMCFPESKENDRQREKSQNEKHKKALFDVTIVLGMS